MRKHIYQNPVTGEKKVFNTHGAHADPENNVELVYLGEEGSPSADQDIRTMTFAGLQQIAQQAKTSNELESLRSVSVTFLTKQEVTALKGLIDRKQSELGEKEAERLSKEQKEKSDAQTKLVHSIVKKIEKAKSKHEVETIVHAAQQETIPSSLFIQIKHAEKSKLKEFSADK